MLANPYALAAAALVGLAVALWSLKDSTDANAEATERHNQLRKEQANLIDDEKNRISGLISTIQDETKSWNERNKAFLALRNSTDGVLNKYSTLNQMLREMSQVLKDINGRYETMNEKMSRDAVKKTNDLIKSKEEQIKKLEEEIKRTASSDRRTALRMDIASIRRSIEQDELLKQKQKREVVKNDVSNYESALSGKSLDQIQAEKKLIIEAYNLRKKQAKESIANHSIAKIDSNNPYLKYDWNELGMFNEATERQIKLKQQENKQIYDKNKLLADSAKYEKEINALQRKNIKDDKDFADIEQKVKAKEEVDKILESKFGYKKSGAKTAKTIKNSLPEFDTEKAQREHNRQIQDDLFAREEARIKIMQDGADKRFAIIQLEYDKQEEEIRRRSEDQLAAFIETQKAEAEAQGKWKKGQDFDTNTESINAEKARLAENEKVLLASNAEYQRMQQEQVYKDLLEKYQTYTDQRKAIEEKYNADIAALQAKLGADAPQVKKAQDEKARELKKLDILYKKEGTAIAKLFDNLRKKTVKEIRQTITEAEAEIDELAKVLNMDDNANVEFITNLKQQLEQARDTADKSDTAFGKLSTSIKNLFKSRPNTAEWQEAFNGMLSSAQSITGQFSQLGDEFERLGQSTGNAALKALGENMQKVSSVLSKTLSFAQMGYSVGKGWGAAIGAVIGLFASGNEIANKAKLENENKLLQISKSKLALQESYNQALYEERLLQKENSSIFGTKELANALGYMKEYKNQWDSFKNSINLRPAYSKEEIETRIQIFKNQWGKSYGDGINEKVKEVRKQMEDLRITDLNLISVATGSHTKGMWWWKKTITEYSNILKAFPELTKGVDGLDVNLAKRILDTQEFSGTGKEKLQEIVNAYERAQEAKKKFNEYTKSTFGELGNSIIDSVYNSLQKGEDAFESFAKTVGNVIGRLGKQLAYEQFVSEAFKNLQKKLTEASKDNNGSEDFARQSSQIVGEFGNAMKGKMGEIQQFLKDWNNMSSGLGFDFLNEQRQAVEKGFARMSQDSADELNGQFRLLTQIGAETKNAMLQTVKEFTEMHKFLQTFSAQQLKHLAGIEVNTFQLHDMRKDIANMKAGINELTTKGIKIRT